VGGLTPSAEESGSSSLRARICWSVLCWFWRLRGLVVDGLEEVPPILWFIILILMLFANFVLELMFMLKFGIPDLPTI